MEWAAWGSEYYSLWRKLTPVEGDTNCQYESSFVESDEDGTRWVQVRDGKHIGHASEDFEVPSEFIYTIRKRVQW